MSVSLKALGIALLILHGGCRRSVLTSEPLLDPTVQSRVSGIDPLPLPPPGPPPEVREDDATRFARPDPTRSGSTVSLTVEQVRSTALRHNLDLAAEVWSPDIARQVVDEERARFDAVFVAGLEAASENSPTGDIVTRSRTLTLEPGVRIPLLTGGSVTVTLPASYDRVELPGGTDVETYDAGVRFSLSHPLLRGAGRYVTTAPVRVAGLESRRAQARTKLEAIYVLANTERVYWDLWAATQTVRIRHEQYGWAEEQVEAAEKLVAAGAAPEVEVTRARAGVARRLQDIVATETRRRLVQRHLKQLMNRPDLSVETEADVLPASPPVPRRYALEPAALALHAVANRMEILELEIDLALDAVSIRVARNETLPSFALGFDYTYRGAGSSFRRALDGLVDDRLSDARLGLTFEVPFGNRAAKARLRRAVLERARTLATRQALAQTIQKEVYDAWTQLEAGWASLLAAQLEVSLSGQTYESEKRQFLARTRTSTDVLFAAEFLADARVREAEALADLQKALVEMAFATGTVLGHSRVYWPRRCARTPSSAQPVHNPRRPSPPPDSIDFRRR